MDETRGATTLGGSPATGWRLAHPPGDYDVAVEVLPVAVAVVDDPAAAGHECQPLLVLRADRGPDDVVHRHLVDRVAVVADDLVLKRAAVSHLHVDLVAQHG